MSKRDINGLLTILICVCIVAIAVGGVSYGFHLISYPETFVHLTGLMLALVSAVAGAAVVYYFVTKFSKNEQ